MPHRFQVFEKIAFSLVVLSAAACSAFIAYETSPDIRQVLHAGKKPCNGAANIRSSAPRRVTDACANFPVN